MADLDELVALLREKRAELGALGQKIAQSARTTTVAFVDLSDSTALKSEVPPYEWLGYVFEFIQIAAKHANSEHGVVVKRIGDEVMLSFADPNACERFVDRLIADPAMSPYRYKVAADSGEAYHFQFAPDLPPDPYGEVVDRCARIAKLAGAGVALCSTSHRNGLANQD